MTDNDPFDQAADRTIIKPSPGGRPRAGSATERAPAIGPPITEPLQTTGVNPVLKAATSLLAIGGQLRRSAKYDDTSDLFRQLSQGLRNFDAELRREGISAEDASIARYVLCGFLDEAILNTPWGSDSGWGSRTLLAEFHNEAFAGEKVFELLNRMQHEPARYLNLLELIYVCLSLGFRGKYRLGAGGEVALEKVRTDLFMQVSKHRRAPERELSPAWRGAQDVRPKLTRYLPTWVSLTVTAALMVGVYVFLLLSLESESDPVVGKIAGLGRDLDPVVERAQAPILTASETLISLLKGKPGMATVEKGEHENMLVLRGLFSSGSADVDAKNFGALRQISEALMSLPGRIVVTGHSDNQPIRSIRFPSNWQLSAARAQAVSDLLLANGLTVERVSSEARADSSPVCASCDQNSPAERQRNRRVEIELLASAQRQ